MKLPFRNNVPVRVTSPYGTRVDPFTRSKSKHDGYDLVSDGDKTVCAVVDGKVVQSRIITDKNNRTWEWGNYVTVLGTDGHYHYYCHLDSRAVEAGATVKAGDVIGVMGATGKVTGAHLHYEVRMADGWTPINPETVLGVPNVAGPTVYTVKPEPKAEPKAKEPELDNVPNAWAEDAVKWAIDNGIIKGNEHGDLRLHYTVTREEAVVMLYRALNGKA